MADYIFFKSSDSGSLFPVLSMLPHQTVPTPNAGEFESDPTWRVAHSLQDMVSSYPTGMVFASPASGVIVFDARSQYSIREMYPVSLSVAKPKSPEHTPPEKAVQEFDDYVSLHPDWDSGVVPEKIEIKGPAPAKKPLTVLETIRRDHPVPSIEDDSFFVEKNVWEQLVRNIRFRRRPTMLTGPTGTGKTELVAKLAEKLGLPLRTYDMGSMHDPLAQLIGQQGLVGGEGGSVTEFQYAQFTSDIQEPGIILLDELSRAPQQANNILFPLLDSRRCLYAEMAGDRTGRVISVHPDCCFVATANIGSAYTGTETLDEALANRFDTIDLDYLPAATETALLQKLTGIDAHSASLIAKVCETVRKKFGESKLSRPLSTRQSILAAENVADGWPLAQSMTLAFEHLFDGTGGSSSERAVVHGIICSH